MNSPTVSRQEGGTLILKWVITPKTITKIIIICDKKKIWEKLPQYSSLTLEGRRIYGSRSSQTVSHTQSSINIELKITQCISTDPKEIKLEAVWNDVFKVDVVNLVILRKYCHIPIILHLTFQRCESVKIISIKH